MLQHASTMKGKFPGIAKALSYTLCNKKTKKLYLCANSSYYRSQNLRNSLGELRHSQILYKPKLKLNSTWFVVGTPYNRITLNIISAQQNNCEYRTLSASKHSKRRRICKRIWPGWVDFILSLHFRTATLFHLRFSPINPPSGVRAADIQNKQDILLETTITSQLNNRPLMSWLFLKILNWMMNQCRNQQKISN